MDHVINTLLSSRSDEVNQLVTMLSLFSATSHPCAFLFQPSKAMSVNTTCPFPVLMPSLSSHVALQVKQHCSLRNESDFQGNVNTVQTSQLAKNKIELQCSSSSGLM